MFVYLIHTCVYSIFVLQHLVSEFTDSQSSEQGRFLSYTFSLCEHPFVTDFMETQTVINSCIFNLDIIIGETEIKTISSRMKTASTAHSGWSIWGLHCCVIYQGFRGTLCFLKIPGDVVFSFRCWPWRIPINYSVDFTVNRDALTKLSRFNFRLSHNNLTQNTCLKREIS